jgi:hypothetical protein
MHVLPKRNRSKICLANKKLLGNYNETTNLKGFTEMKIKQFLGHNRPFIIKPSTHCQFLNLNFTLTKTAHVILSIK